MIQDPEARSQSSAARWVVRWAQPHMARYRDLSFSIRIRSSKIKLMDDFPVGLASVLARSEDK